MKRKYSVLLEKLYYTRFRAKLSYDLNRIQDGESLRYRFAYDTGILDYFENERSGCSVLELMVALTFSMKEIANDGSDNQQINNFKNMLKSLGLYKYDDEHYVLDEVNSIIDVFLSRKYEADGKGGLFTINNCEYDLRDVEIWNQMCWWLNTLYF